MAASFATVTISSFASKLPLQNPAFQSTVKYSPSWFRFRAFNGDSPQAPTPEDAGKDAGKLALEELDQQLSMLSERSTPAPRPLVDPRMELWKKTRNRGELPEITDGFLLYVGAPQRAREAAEAAKSPSTVTEMDRQEVVVNNIEMAPQLADEQ